MATPQRAVWRRGQTPTAATSVSSSAATAGVSTLAPLAGGASVPSIAVRDDARTAVLRYLEAHGIGPSQLASAASAVPKEARSRMLPLIIGGCAPTGRANGGQTTRGCWRHMWGGVQTPSGSRGSQATLARAAHHAGGHWQSRCCRCTLCVLWSCEPLPDCEPGSIARVSWQRSEARNSTRTRRTRSGTRSTRSALALTMRSRPVQTAQTAEALHLPNEEPCIHFLAGGGAPPAGAAAAAAAAASAAFFACFSRMMLASRSLRCAAVRSSLLP